MRRWLLVQTKRGDNYTLTPEKKEGLPYLKATVGDEIIWGGRTGQPGKLGWQGPVIGHIEHVYAQRDKWFEVRYNEQAPPELLAGQREQDSKEGRTQ